jgi:pyruvate/2-oxoglutarate/acetoin dehydrogenase E1 component
MTAAGELSPERISVEIVDSRTPVPLDKGRSVRKPVDP